MRYSTSLESLDRLKKNLRTIYYKTCGDLNGFDDCFQSIVLKFLEGRGQHQLLKYAVIDYLRENSMREVIRDVNEFKAEYKDPEIESVIDKIDNKTARAYLVLRFKWGFSLDEIADCFGVCKQAVSKLITFHTKNINKRTPK